MSNSLEGLASRYSFKEVESRIRNFWKEQNVFAWNAEISRDESYVIDTPPPTISGHLHMGHVFSYCHTDFIARFQRMIGKNVFYPMGFDNNGLPTERLVEKVKGIKAREIERKDFVHLCNQLIEEEMPKFRALFEELGLSIDWSFTYSTASKESCRLSQMSFLDLVHKGEIYRSEQAVFWDPIDCTAISQSEIELKEQCSLMHEIVFDLTDSQKVTIATTRPEILPACVAIFYNPLDSRYSNLDSKFAVTPLFGVKVPIIADTDVVMEKGTGLVMCCTFGDMLDVQWWKKYNLPLREVLNSNGLLSEIDFGSISLNADLARENFASLRGLFVTHAREKIVQLLENQGFLTSKYKVENVVKCAERSGSPLEVRVTKQWFIRALPHREALLKKALELKWYPEGMKARLNSWIEGLSADWCISRQRFFGIPLPVWYSKVNGEPIFPDFKDLPVDPALSIPNGYKAEEIEADFDVMDTWATSSISPQINAGGISKALSGSHYEKLFPADLRPQGHEIIRTWAFGTILKSYLHSDTLPWKDIMISGWCLFEDKQKMSKSRGNIIVPSGVLSEYGSDVVRYWSASAKLGGNIAFSKDILQDGKKFITKLWNASRFALMHVREIVPQCPTFENSHAKILCAADSWILHMMDKLILETSQHLQNYHYHIAKQAIVTYFKRDFCDRYIELVKARVNDQNCLGKLKESAQLTLYFCIRNLLKLCAPFFPYVTEELFSYFDTSGKSIHAKGQWPLPFGKDFAFTQHMNVVMSITDFVFKNGLFRSQVILHVHSSPLPQDLLFDLKGMISVIDVVFHRDESSLPVNKVRNEFCVLGVENISQN